MKKIIFIVFYFVSFQSIANDFPLPSNFADAYDAAFRLEIKSSKQAINGIDKNNPFRIYLENYIDFIEILNTDQESLFNKALPLESVRLKQLEELYEGSPYQKFLRAEILLHWGILKLKFGKEAKGAYNIIQAAKLLSANKKQFPDFLPTYKSLGSVQVVIGSVPENYRWALKLLGLKGNIDQGFDALEKASKDKIWGNEALYSSFFLKAFTSRFSANDNAALLKYVNNKPADLNAYFLGSSISLRTGRAAQSNDFLNKKPGGASYLVCPIFDLQRGDALISKGDYRPAANAYLSFLKQHKGKAYLKDANLKLYYAYYLMGENDKAAAYLSRVALTGNTNSDYDKTAQKYATLIGKTAPDKALIRARLSVEGGYIKDATADLVEVETQKLQYEWQSEYQYLHGVTSYYSNKYDSAAGYFSRAIAINEKLNWTGGSANSALYLGYVYQAKKQNNQAVVYFEKALSYKGHEQKNTVDTKARAALTEMKIST